MKILKWCSLIMLAIAVGACGSKQAEKVTESDLLQLFGKDPKSMFRGSEMGEKTDAVMGREGAALIFASDSLLEYQLSFSFEEENIPSKIYYSFDEFGLFEIQVDMSKSAGVSSTLHSDIEQILSERFGDGEKDGAYLLWTTNSPSNRLVEITLSEDQQLDGKPFLSLNYLEQLDGEL